MSGPFGVSGSFSSSCDTGFDGANTHRTTYNSTYNVANNTSMTVGIGYMRKYSPSAPQTIGDGTSPSETPPKPSNTFNETAGAVIEGKLNYNFNEHFSAQGRVRSYLAPDIANTQYRASLGYRTNITPTTSVYANAYGAVKTDYLSGKVSTDVGAFAGVSQKIDPNTSVSFDVRRGNLIGGANTPDNWEANVTVSWKF